MLNFWHTYRLPILFWIFCGLAFVVWLTVLYPLYFDVCDPAERGKAQNCEQYQVALAILLKIGQVLSHAETWTAIGTILIAIFTWTLWRSTRNLWNVTKITAEHILRVERAELVPLV
jgi:Trk-type K+ transport system membrane component